MGKRRGAGHPSSTAPGCMPTWAQGPVLWATPGGCLLEPVRRTQGDSRPQTRAPKSPTQITAPSPSAGTGPARPRPTSRLPSPQAVRTPSRSFQAKESRSAQRRPFSVRADSNLERAARRPVISTKEKANRPRA